MTSAVSVELLVSDRADVGEGPLWDSEAGLLYWVDISRGDLHSWNPRTGSQMVTETGQSLGSIALAEDGKLLLALRDGLHVLDKASGKIEIMLPIDYDMPQRSLNDSACDRLGRLWVGSVADDETPRSGCVYRVDAHLRVTQAIPATTLANGIGWSPDDRVMYFADSSTFTVFAFDYHLDTGDASNRRSFVVTDPAQGLPDGLTVDEEGYIWVAYWGGGCVRRYSPEGELDRVLELPASQVSSCTFGGKKLDELYITTATYGLSPDQLAAEPTAGSLFRASLNVRGLEPSRFRRVP